MKLLMLSSNFKICNTKFDEVKVIKIKKNIDDRGFFQRLFCTQELNFKGNIVNINNSFSKKKGTTRGLHYQIGKWQEHKFIKCIHGELINIVVDTRKNSKNYLKHIKIKLSRENNHMSSIPPGFANGIQTLKNNTEIIYFVSNFYNPKKERGLSLFDPLLNIKLPLKPSILSKKDLNWQYLNE